MEAIQKAIIIYCIMSFLIFIAAIFQLVSSFSLIAILGCSLLLMIPFRRLKLDRPNWPSLEAADKRSLVVSFSLMFILFAHIVIIPSYARDDIIYHLLVPKQLFGSGGFVFDPYNINSNFPMLFELPLTLSFITDLAVPPFIVNYLVLICLSVAFYLMARRIYRINHLLSLSAVLVLLGTPVIYDQVHSSYVELFMSLLLLVAFYNYAIFRSHRGQVRYWYLTMLFCGLLCTTKYTGGVFAAFILVIEFFASKDRSLYYKGAMVCVLICLPWYLKNWILLGNPVFPLLGFLFPSEFVSIERSIYYKHLFADYHAGNKLIDYILLPWRLLIGFDPLPAPGQMGFGGKLSFFFICAYASVVSLVKRKQTNDISGYERVVALLFVAYAVFWTITSQQVRFFLPVLILASLSGLSLVNTHWQKLKIPVLLVFGLIFLQNAVNIGSAVKNEKIDDLVSGKMTREQFLDHHLPISYLMANKLNDLLDPRRHRLLAIGNFGRNFYFDIDTITNTYYEPEILAKSFHAEKIDTRIFENFIREEKITHLLINHAFLNHFFSENSSFAMEALNKYLGRLPIVLKQKSVVVYELNI